MVDASASEGRSGSDSFVGPGPRFDAGSLADSGSPSNRDTSVDGNESAEAGSVGSDAMASDAPSSDSGQDAATAFVPPCRGPFGASTSPPRARTTSRRGRTGKRSPISRTSGAPKVYMLGFMSRITPLLK